MQIDVIPEASVARVDFVDSQLTLHFDCSGMDAGDHADRDDGRREHVTSEFDASCDNRCRVVGTYIPGGRIELMSRALRAERRERDSRRRTGMEHARSTMTSPTSVKNSSPVLSKTAGCSSRRVSTFIGRCRMPSLKASSRRTAQRSRPSPTAGHNQKQERRHGDGAHRTTVDR